MNVIQNAGNPVLITGRTFPVARDSSRTFETLRCQMLLNPSTTFRARRTPFTRSGIRTTPTAKVRQKTGPRMSTITCNITVFNDWPKLERTLDSIAGQDSAPEQLIVADDGSEDSLGVNLASWANARDIPITHVWHPNAGFRKCELLNMAATQVRCDFILYIDHDCLVPKNFVRSHAAFASEDMIHVGPRIHVMPPSSGRFRPTPPSIITALFRRNLVGCLSAVRGAKVLAKPPKVIEGCNMMVPTRAIREVNGYDNRYRSKGYGVDADLVVRGWFAGYKMGVSGISTTVYHLWHNASTPQENRARFKEMVARRVARCDDGLSAHMSVTPLRTRHGAYERVVFPS
jgi:GT2 family glycosyltransferase